MATLLLILGPALLTALGFAADSGLLSFNNPRGAMPRVPDSEPSTGGFTSKNVEYVGFLPFEEGGQPEGFRFRTSAVG